VVEVRIPLLPAGAVREYLADARVSDWLRREAPDGAEDVEQHLVAAGGAPGRLLAIADRSEAIADAKLLLDAALSGSAAARYQAAFSQGGRRARGGFSDTLDALTALLHERARRAVDRSDRVTAMAAVRGVEAVERAKEWSAGNVNPQLLSESRVHALAGGRGAAR